MTLITDSFKFIPPSAFNPVTDIATWQTFHQPSGATDLPGVGWVNEGTSGLGNAGQAENPLPVFNGSEVDFDDVTEQHLSLPQISKTTGWELWSKVFLEGTTFQRIISFNNTHHFRNQSGGAINWGGTTLSYSLSTGLWYNVRWVIDGASSSVEIRDDADNILHTENFTASTGTSGSGDGRLGSNTPTGNPYDGRMRVVGISSAILSPQDITNMFIWIRSI